MTDKKKMTTTDIAKVKFVRKSLRGSKYAALFKRLEDGLRPDTAILVPQAKNCNLQNRRNAIALAVKNKMDPPAGYKWSFAATEDNAVAVMLVKK